MDLRGFTGTVSLFGLSIISGEFWLSSSVMVSENDCAGVGGESGICKEEIADEVLEKEKRLAMDLRGFAGVGGESGIGKEEIDDEVLEKEKRLAMDFRGLTVFGNS